MISNSAIRAVVSSEKETVTSGASNSGLRGKLNKVVLAYSGGLDTSVIVPWLRYTCCLCFVFKTSAGQIDSNYLFFVESTFLILISLTVAPTGYW